MIKNKINITICTIALAGHLSLMALQQTRTIQVPAQSTTQNNASTTPVYMQGAFNTIARWISSNPAAALTAIGTTGTAGYLLYRQLSSWLTKPKLQSLPAPIPAEEQPLRVMMPAVRTLTTIPQRSYTGILQPSAQSETLQHLTTQQVPAQIASEEFVLLESPSNGLKKAIMSHYYHSPSSETVIAQYNAGRSVFLRIMAQKAYQLTKEDVRNLMWFFYIYAVASKTNYKFFDEGTFRIRGEKWQIDALYQALGSSEVKPYARMSSHYNEYFKFPTQPAWYDVLGWANYASEFYNYLFSHQGLDIEGLPPAQMGTIVFAKLTDDQMYIKPEPHGVQNPIDLIKHTQDYMASLARKNLPDPVKAFVAQFVTMSSDDAENFQKERVPGGIRNKANDFVKRAETILSTTSPEETKKRISELKTQIDSWGIQQIVPKIADYASDEKIRKADPQLHVELEKYLNELMKLYADWQHRKGNEITFTIDELLKARPINHVVH